MAQADKHDWQSKRNMRLLEEIGQAQLSSAYNEWKITLLFYSALHRVQIFFADNTYNFPKHHRTHKDTCRILNNYPLFEKIVGPYTTLRNLSRISRYNCVRLSCKDFMDAKKHTMI